MSGIVFGIIFYLIGIGVDKLRDFILVRKNYDGTFDARYRRGSVIGKIFKGIGILMAVAGLYELFTL